MYSPTFDPPCALFFQPVRVLAHIPMLYFPPLIGRYRATRRSKRTSCVVELHAEYGVRAPSFDHDE
jgi:hypothetical protein